MAAKEDFDDSGMPELVDDSDSEASEEEVEFNETPCPDLFSEKQFPSARSCLKHCKDVHGFDLAVLEKRFSMDYFSYIKIINYIRTHKPTAGEIMHLTSSDLWEKDDYLKPVINDDPLLMYDFEDIKEENDNLDGYPVVPEANKLSKNEIVGIIREMKARFSDADEKPDPRPNEQPGQNLYSLMSDIRNSTSENVVQQQAQGWNVGSRSSAEDSHYADSYSHFGIHHEMLSDVSRTEAYRDAIQLYSQQISGKTVLDLGCGTGILSMFCADLGNAAKVIGVDMSEIIHYAIDIVNENNYQNIIVLLKGRLEDLDLKPHLSNDCKFDVLVSEWMGYFLLYEGMLDSVIAARDRFLKPGGLILPNRFTMHLVGVADVKRYGESVDFWKNVYGYKMSCMKKPSLREASVEVVSPATLITEPVQIHELDVNTCTLNDTEFEKKFNLTVTKDGCLTSVAGYFDSFFDQDPAVGSIVLGTGPTSKPTHWKQTVFFLDKKVLVKKGSTLSASIKVNRHDKNPRALKVTLIVEEQTQSYVIE